MNRLKQLREEFNMTQQELANKLDCAKSSIAMYEKGSRKPSLDILIKLAEFFNCSIDYILNLSEVRSNDHFHDPFDLSEMGINIQDYTPPTYKQKEQLAELIKIFLKDNKK